MARRQRKAIVTDRRGAARGGRGGGGGGGGGDGLGCRRRRGEWFINMLVSEFHPWEPR